MGTFSGTGGETTVRSGAVVSASESLMPTLGGEDASEETAPE
ncbi:unannotated protein [freshwater metagenome]|uniref:Unannotated protein n=1 Tax=freshwater metagenome TaxID=449393 RepID=A0A6J7UJF4_9ZZZZ